MKKTITALLGVFLGFAVAFLPLEALGPEARAALGVLAWAIVWWVFRVLPDFVTAMIMAVLFLTVCRVPAGTVFSAFSGSSWWLLFTAFGLSLGVKCSGLMLRISLHVLRIFPNNFPGQVLGQLAVGLVTAPFIPSMSAKSAMLTPLAMGVSDSMGYEPRGKQATGIFLAMLTGLRSPGPLFISASVLGYALLGQYPAELAGEYTMGYWFTAALPWFLFVSLVNYLAIVCIFRPAKEPGTSREELSRRIKALGPMTAAEKKMLGVMLGVMLLWVSEPLHGVPPFVSAIAALCAAIALGVVKQENFSAGMNWGSIIFIGLVLGLAPVFEQLGINRWIVEACGGVFSYFMEKPVLMLACIGTAVVLLRFVIVSELALVNIIMVFLVPLAMEHGINPWIIGFAVYALVNPWFFLYQNPVYMAAYYSVDGKMAEPIKVSLYCLVYLVICVAGLMVSLPWWRILGIYNI